MADDFSDIHDALGIRSTDDVGPLPAAKFFAKGAGELTGVSDLVRAVQSGRPENMLYAGGMLGLGALLPGGKAEKVAGMTMSKLFPEATWLGSSGLMHPQEYVDKLGGVKSFAQNFPASFEKMKPHLQPENLDVERYAQAMAEANQFNLRQPLPVDYEKATPKVANYNEIVDRLGVQGKPITQEAIDKALAKNPGASIMDVAGTHVGGPSDSWKESAWHKNFMAAQEFAKANALTPKEFPHEVPFGVPDKARELGFTTPALHGTHDRWGWQGPLDQLKLPDEQLGVHFGNPSQAAHFSIPGDVPGYMSDKATYASAKPRVYPAVLQVQNPLETRDMGSWGHEEMIDALSQINRGEHVSYTGGKRVVSPQAQGQFPQNELDKLNDIHDVRDYIASKGYDSIKYTNTVEDPGHTSYILFQDSPTQRGYVIGARSPFAQFDPSKLHLPSLAASGAGILAYPLTSRNGGTEE